MFTPGPPIRRTASPLFPALPQRFPDGSRFPSKSVSQSPSNSLRSGSKARSFLSIALPDPIAAPRPIPRPVPGNHRSIQPAELDHGRIRPRVHRFVLLVLFLLGAIGPGMAQKEIPSGKQTAKTPDQAEQNETARPYPPGILWMGDVKKALAEARERHCPIMVAFIAEHKLCNMVVAGLYTDKETIRLSRKMVCLVASRGQHPHIPGHGPDGRLTRVCKRFGSVSCEQHQQVERWAFSRLNEKGSIQTPEHVFLDAEGRLLMRVKHVLATTSSMFHADMKKALERVGPGLDAITYRTFRAKLKTLDRWIRNGRHAEAIQTLLPFLARAGRSSMAGQARALLARVEDAATRELAAVDQLMAAGDFAAARTRCEQNERVFHGLDAARLFQDRLKLLQGKGKRSPDRVKALLERAERHFQQKAYLRAEALYRRIVTRHGDTPAATVARRRLASFQADVELKKALTQDRIDTECKRWMKLADALVKSGRIATACDYYQKIIQAYPESSHARVARQKIQQHGRE
jgi:tetratricopeptide (TPR) repeat protein